MIGIWTMLLILSRYVGEGMHIICILNIYYDTTSTQWRDVVVISLLLSSIVSTLLAFISFVDRAFDTKWKKINQSRVTSRILIGARAWKTTVFAGKRIIFCVNRLVWWKSCFFWTWMNSWRVSDISSRDAIWGTLGRAIFFSLSACFFWYSLPASLWLALLLSY